jgi:hypothetical protein
MSKAIVNLTTEEYFIYSSEEDKIKKLNKLTDYTSETKILAFILKEQDDKIRIEDCGECYWSKSDKIKIIDIDKLYLYKNFDEVPKHYIE